MTKKLRKMLEAGRSVGRRKKVARKKKPEDKNRKKKTKLKKDRCVHRGIRFAPSVTLKTAMTLLHDHIRLQKRKPPAIDMANSDPASQFMILMYEEIGRWSIAHMNEFIEEVTGEPPKKQDGSALLGTVKCIFHAIFDEEDTSRDNVLKLTSTWRMWPKVRNREVTQRTDMSKFKAERTEREEEDVMASKKKKQAVKKKKTAKKSTKKSAKKTAKKTAKKKSGGRLSPIEDDTMVVRVKASSGERPMWDEFLTAMGAKKQSFKSLCTTIGKKLEGDAEYTRRVFGSLRRRGLVKTVD